MIKRFTIAIGTLLLITISFYFYGLVNYKGFDSDMAIHVLMAEDFNFPQSLYYSGQDRLGSIIPMVATLFYAIGFKSIWAVSLAQYALLLCSFGFLQSFLKKPIAKLILLTVLLFPHSSFQAQLLPGHPYLGHLFFLSAFLWIYLKASLKSIHKAFLTPLAAMLMLWASEIAIVNLIAFAMVYGKSFINYLRPRKNIYAALGGVILGITWIIIGKMFSWNDPRFIDLFASVEEIKTGFINIWNLLIEAALFQSNKPPNSLLFWSSIILIIGLSIKPSKISRLTLFFLLGAAGTLVLIMLSQWSARHDYPLRYLIPAYLQFMLGIIYYWSEKPLNKQRLSFIPILMVACFSGYSGYYLLNNFTMEVSGRVNREEIRQLANKGSFGIIGSYWNTYSVDAWSDKIVGTPHDKAYVRIGKNVPRVFAKDSIMVIKNQFVKTLPDTLIQFDNSLVKIDSSQKLNEFEYAFYRPL